MQDGYRAFRAALLDRRAEVAAVMLSRSTQTNEPARCAVLLPALARLAPPLALIEVGASAGLTLLPDPLRIRLRRAADRAGRPGRARADLPAARPGAGPGRGARGGLAGRDRPESSGRDRPRRRGLAQHLDLAREPGRPERLSAAVAVARRRRPRVIAGDLIDQLPGLAGQAPAGATLVIFHTSVLSYVEPARRAMFAGLVAELGAAWLSSESRGVLTWLPDRWTTPQDSAHLLVRNGQHVLGLGDSHGTWLDWRERAVSPGVPAAGSDR